MSTVNTAISDELAASQTLGRTAQRLAILGLSTGGFAIGVGEFTIMGLLPDAAQDLSISIPAAGHLISLYALGVVIGAPLLAVAGAQWAKRSFLIGLMVCFAIGNVASALAPGYVSMLVARLLTGFPHGAYFGVASLVAASLVERERRTQAVALVLMGLTVATLVGVPAAAAIGQWFGWRAAYVLVGLIALLAAVLIWRYVPFVEGNRAASPLSELSALCRGQVWLTLLIGAVGFGGMFSVFTYIKPTLLELTHLPEAVMPLVLGLFGAGMVVGNLVGARLADRALLPTIGGILVWAIAVLMLFVFTVQSVWLAPVNVFLVGTLIALGPCLQTRLMDVAGEAQTLAAALNHSAFNAANALGAWLGGVAVSQGLGWDSTAWVGALLAVGGLLVFAVSMSVQRVRHA
ncbi:MAG: Inner membrane transport protein YdhP [Pseudomonas sp.]|nr:MAG: Inner membrane transport protein YdhP [Pseudomonas sp.]